MNSEDKNCKIKQMTEYNPFEYRIFEHKFSEDKIYEWNVSPDTPDFGSSNFLKRWAK